MVAVVEQLGGAFGESGLLVLPCVAAHLNHVIHLFVHIYFVFIFVITDIYKIICCRLFWNILFSLTSGFGKI
jgi:hypothetical protein